MTYVRQPQGIKYLVSHLLNYMLTDLRVHLLTCLLAYLLAYQYDDWLHRQEALGDRDEPRVHECLRTVPSVHSLV